ncbi:MAG: hypothetical protein EOM40_19100 [Clostridia bacterium]|nr:hypothetical protein [Clostridia bacterium]
MNDLKKNKSKERLSIQIGYVCYLYCEVERDGKVVRIKSTDGETDYYELSSSWAISAISRYFFKRKVSLYSIQAEVKEEMENYIVTLSEMYQ